MSARRGFSLLELLVAMAILGVLAAGLGQVLAGSLETFAAVREGLAMQRTLRWAIQELEGDLRATGLLFPPPWLRPMPLDAEGGPGLRQACFLWPNQPLTKWVDGALAPLRAGEDPLAAPGRTSDVLGLVLDRPLAEGGDLAAGIPGPHPAGGILVRLEGPCRLEAGDLVWVAGDRFECAVVLEPVALAGGAPETIPVGPALEREGPAFRWGHPAGARVGLVRPLRMVRLAVVYLELPGAGTRVPCLVRFESAYRAPDPLQAWTGPGDGWGPPEVLAERVTALGLDLSLDGHWPGIRGADPAATAARLEQALLGRGLDPAAPLAFRGAPAILRVQLEARSPGPPVRHARMRWAYRLRNFGAGP